MRNVSLFTLLACLAIGSLVQGQVPPNVENDYYDLGLLVPEVVPADKGDVIVVYGASWCGPCQAMKPTWTLLKGQGYKVLYINVDDAGKYVGTYGYVNEDLRAEAFKTRGTVSNSIPLVRFYNTSTKSFIDDHIVGYTSPANIKKHTWKNSSSKGYLPELRR